MGRKGLEIIEVDAKGIIKTLQAAYADEWLAHYHYLYAAQVIVGINAPQIAAVLRTRANEELTHAMLLGERILQLGGELPEHWSDIPKLAHCVKAFTMPRDLSDLKGVLQSALQVERCAIDSYQHLLKQTLHKDTVTHELAEELLADEVKDEEELENLLGE